MRIYEADAAALSTRLKLIATVGGLMKCLVPEFDSKTYKGLSSGIGKERKSSKHFKCTKPCCSPRPTIFIRKEN